MKLPLSWMEGRHEHRTTWSIQRSWWRALLSPRFVGYPICKWITSYDNIYYTYVYKAVTKRHDPPSMAGAVESSRLRDPRENVRHSYCPPTVFGHIQNHCIFGYSMTWSLWHNEPHLKRHCGWNVHGPTSLTAAKCNWGEVLQSHRWRVGASIGYLGHSATVLKGSQEVPLQHWAMGRPVWIFVWS